MRVAFKYCGGCNPRWDRTEIAARTASDEPGISLVRAGEPADIVAVVCGCEAACAEHETLRGEHGKIILTQAADYEKLRRLLRTI